MSSANLKLQSGHPLMDTDDSGVAVSSASSTASSSKQINNWLQKSAAAPFKSLTQTQRSEAELNVVVKDGEGIGATILYSQRMPSFGRRRNVAPVRCNVGNSKPVNTLLPLQVMAGDIFGPSVVFLSNPTYKNIAEFPPN